eukprot:NODE_2144_length_628_cov_12.490501_g1688_i0.p1 GENE.NODE_2144_length_628_cov_12.490501_g1688_i0~~NODE_2144_length_628_cov_12.490501_g1688_i0.p1  ORF type:complete len:176 (-),score=58.77 NODE_2144_length_628_cov_12.490501_g1688_i0:101-577(-)
MGGPCTCDGKVHHEMDNSLVCQFTIDGVVWRSAEQYFQAMKFQDPVHQETIRRELDGNEIWRLGQSRQHPCRPDWEAIKVDVMYKGNLAKFQQNEAFRAKLISTKGRIGASGFPFWVKWNPIILQRVREELRSDAERDVVELDRLKKLMADYRTSAAV